MPAFINVPKWKPKDPLADVRAKLFKEMIDCTKSMYSPSEILSTFHRKRFFDYARKIPLTEAPKYVGVLAEWLCVCQTLSKKQSHKVRWSFPGFRLMLTESCLETLIRPLLRKGLLLEDGVVSSLCDWICLQREVADIFVPAGKLVAAFGEFLDVTRADSATLRALGKAATHIANKGEKKVRPLGKTLRGMIRVNKERARLKQI